MKFIKEKRKFIRIRVQDEIGYRIIPYCKSERKLTQDLSLGGVRFICDHFIPLRSTLKLEIKLKDARTVINGIARVVWIRAIFNDEQYEVGAEFLDIKNEDLKSLNNYLSK